MKYLKSSSCLPLHWMLETLKRYMPLNEMFFCVCVCVPACVCLYECVLSVLSCVLDMQMFVFMSACQLQE